MADSEIKLRITSDASSAISSLTKFGSKLKETDSLSARIGKTMMNSWGGVAAALALPVLIGGFASFVKTTLEAKDNLSETAQKAGIAATSLQLYQYSAKLAGVSNEALVNGIGILSKNMMGAAEDIGGSAKAFEALGLSTKDAFGNLKSSETMIGEIADKFASMEDGTGKTAIAMALFGKSGKEMIPFLNEGSEGLETLRQRMIALGYSFDENAIKKAADANDRLDELGMAVKNVGSRIVMSLLPQLEALTENMFDLIENGDGLSNLVDVSVTGLKRMASTALAVAAAFDIMGTSIGEAAARYVKSYEESGLVSRFTGFATAKAGYSALFGGLNGPSALNDKLAGYKSMISGLWSEPEWLGPESHTPTKSKSPMITDAKAASKALEELAKAQSAWQEKIDQMDPTLDAFDKKVIQLEADAEKLREQFGNQAWITEGEEWGRAFIQQSEEIAAAEKQAEMESERAAKTEQIAAENRQKLLDITLQLISAESQRAEMNLQYDSRSLELDYRYGKIGSAQMAASSFDLEVKRLELMRNGLSLEIQKRTEATGYEDTANGILKLGLQQKNIEEEINRLLGLRTMILKEHEGGYGEGFSTGWAKYFDDMGSEFQRGEKYAKDTASAMHSAFEDFFFDPMNMSWENLWKSMQRVAARAMSDIAMDAMRTLGKGALNLLFGAGAGGQNIALGNEVDLFSFHKGGIVGAPRLHSGLMPGEYPAILQKGEGVFTPAQMKALGGKQVTVNIINNGNAEVSTQSRETTSGIELDVMIDQAVASKLSQFGSASNRSMRQNFTTTQRLVRR
jgi:hypothetical protein